MPKRKKGKQTGEPKATSNQTGNWIVIYFGEMKRVLSVHYIKNSERYDTKEEIEKFMPKGCDHYELVKVTEQNVFN